MPLKCINRVRVLINNLPAFPTNLNSFYIKIVELPTKASIKTLNRPRRSLRVFPWNSFESKDLWRNGLVVKALDSQSRGPVLKTTG